LKNTEVVLVNVLDSEELDPSLTGDTILEDPESSSTLRAYLSKNIKSDYKSRLQNHVEDVEELCDEYKADYVLASTGDDFFDSFIDVWRSVNQ